MRTSIHESIAIAARERASGMPNLALKGREDVVGHEAAEEVVEIKSAGEEIVPW